MNTTKSFEAQLSKLQRVAEPFYHAQRQSNRLFLYYMISYVPILAAIVVPIEQITFDVVILTLMGSLMYFFAGAALSSIVFNRHINQLANLPSMQLLLEELSHSLRLVKSFHYPPDIKAQALKTLEQQRKPNPRTLIGLIDDVRDLLQLAIKDEQVRQFLTSTPATDSHH